MKNHYFKPFLSLFFCLFFLIKSQQLYAQTPGTMEFGTSTILLDQSTNPSVDQSANAPLLNGFDLSAVGVDIILAFALSGNGSGTNAIGGIGDAVLTFIGDGSDPISSGTISTDSSGEIGLTSMMFAYEQALGGATVNFTITGRRDNTDVGTIVLTAPTHNTAINIDFTSPTTGAFINIDELVITTSSPFFGGFAIDDLVVVSANANVDPTISIDNSNLIYTELEAAKQIDATGTVNDVDGDADWNGGTLVVQITANNEAADEISIADTDGDGTAITVSGTNILANGTDIGDLSANGGIVTNGTALTITFDSDATNANVQEVLQSLRYRNTSTSPGTSNRTITVTATDVNAADASDTRTISISTVAPANPVVTTPSGTITLNAATQTISGTHTENGITVHAYADNDNNGTADNTISLGSATVIGNAWSFSVNLIANFANNFVINATDGIDTSNDVDVPTITEDSTNPADPFLISPSANISVNAATQTIAGIHAENGVTVHAYVDTNNDGTADNTISLGSATVTGNAWSFSINLTADSNNNFVVQAIDNAGNMSNDVDVPTIIEDSTNATITSVAVPSNATYIENENLDFTINFNENITVNTSGGTPQLSITIGSTVRQAIYQSGTNTSALLFRYIIQSGDLDTDGITIGTLDDNGGSLQDDANNEATLTLNNIGNTTDVLVNATLSTNNINNTINAVKVFKSLENEITISGLESNAELTIFTILGKELVKTKINSSSSNKINLPSFTPGIYVIIINSDLGIISKKIML